MSAFQGQIPKKHVLFLTYPLFGHIIPMLELAKRTSQFHHVTFVVSNSVLSEVYKRELISSDDRLDILGLDDGFETDLDKITLSSFDDLFQSIRDLKPSMDTLLGSMPISGRGGNSGENSRIEDPVDVVVVERFMTSICLPICRDLGIPSCIFNASSATSMGSGLDVTKDTPSVPDDGPEQGLPESLKKFFLNVNGHNHLASAFVVNTFRECEPRGVDDLVVDLQTETVPLFCVGPIFPPTVETRPDSTNAIIETSVKKWLDRQKAHSVVYVSFGSMVYMTKEQIEMIVRALISTKKPFIYSIPQSLQFKLPEEIRQQVDCQFEQEKSPFLVLSWAPQKTILHHPSVSVFVTHAGWNSTIESISGGVPMVAWPMFADQPENGNWIVEKGIGALIPDTKLIGGRLVPFEEIVHAVQRAEKCQENSKILAKEAECALLLGGSSHRDFMKLMKFDLMLPTLAHV